VRLRITGRFTLEVDGQRYTARNTPTHEGVKELMGRFLRTGNDPFGQTGPEWWMGFVNTAGFSAYSPTDTLASHAGWVESAHDRLFIGGSAAVVAGDNLSASISLQSSENIDPAVTVRGLFLSSVETGSSGFLWATADIDEGSVSIPLGAAVVATYTITLGV